jgi:hypothetical protein
LAISCLGSVYWLWSTNNAGNWTLYRVAVGLHEDPDCHIHFVKESKRNAKLPDTFLYGQKIGPEFEFQLVKNWLSSAMVITAIYVAPLINKLMLPWKWSALPFASSMPIVDEFVKHQLEVGI